MCGQTPSSESSVVMLPLFRRFAFERDGSHNRHVSPALPLVCVRFEKTVAKIKLIYGLICFSLFLICSGQLLMLELSCVLISV